MARDEAHCGRELAIATSHRGSGLGDGRRPEQRVRRGAADIASAFIAPWRTVLSRSDSGAGCLVAAVTVAAQSSVPRERAVEIFRTWRTRLAELLEAGGVPLASSLIAACEGAVILSRAERSIEPFDQATDEQLQRIRAELAATGAA